MHMSLPIAGLLVLQLIACGASIWHGSSQILARSWFESSAWAGSARMKASSRTLETAQ